ncbi:TPA: antirestriction protein [Providencia alcalifaciens]|uniref:antirestriction protein n=1 Tax=Providencia rettgeri TaxID=587 RepID=UPI001419A900|nr:antirestriction protein [Providencia rettgeri]NIH06996.1 antirestriction protein [Providencia rettgeri]
MTQQQNLAAQESNERNGKDQIVITAIEVKNAQARLTFLPSKLGRYCIAFENAIYHWMTRNAVAYNGGYWHFYTLSNGGFYLQPTKGYMLTSPNGFMDDVSAQEAGIIVTLMMLSHFSFVTYEKEHHEDCERISAYFHQLRDFIFTLSPESQTKILNAID